MPWFQKDHKTSAYENKDVLLITVRGKKNPTLHKKSAVSCAPPLGPVLKVLCRHIYAHISPSKQASSNPLFFFFLLMADSHSLSGIVGVCLQNFLIFVFFADSF